LPNHVHFILWIHPLDDVGATLAVAHNAVAQYAPWTIPEPEVEDYVCEALVGGEDGVGWVAQGVEAIRHYQEERRRRSNP